MDRYDTFVVSMSGSQCAARRGWVARAQVLMWHHDASGQKKDAHLLLTVAD